MVTGVLVVSFLQRCEAHPLTGYSDIRTCRPFHNEHDGLLALLTTAAAAAQALDAIMVQSGIAAPLQ